MVNNVQTSSASADIIATLNAKAKAGTSAAASDASATQDRFLKLLVTQMKNQDPLNPLDNAQVTSQMAQLSTVTGIDRVNAALQALSDSMTSNQSLQAATMIGHGVLVPGDGVDLANGAGFGGIELTQSAERLDVSIYDKSGALVRSVNLGAQPVGLVNWQWDGRDDAGAQLADGAYTFAATALIGGKSTEVDTLQFGMVNSVTQGKQGVALTVGNMDGVALSQVRQIV